MSEAAGGVCRPGRACGTARQNPSVRRGRDGSGAEGDDSGARAEALHRSSPVFVGHDHYCDEEHPLAMHRAGLAGKVTLASVDARVFSDVEDRERSLHEYTGFTEPAWQEMRRIRAIVDAHPDALLLARGAGDIVRAHETGRSAVLLGFEGGKPIERDLGLLHEAYGLGLRVQQLTWAGGNDICDRRDPPVCEGLTDFGRQAVREMNRLGVLIDPGHCSRKTFFQVMELSSRPVAFLHGTPRGAIPGAGDLDDDQLRAVAATGGVVGLHFFSHYLHTRRAPRRPPTWSRTSSTWPRRSAWSASLSVATTSTSPTTSAAPTACLRAVTWASRRSSTATTSWSTSPASSAAGDSATRRFA